MTSIGFDVGVEVSDTLETQLRRLEFTLGPVFMAWFLEMEMGTYLKMRATTRFQKEGDDASGKWKPLAEFTVQDRISQGFGGAHPINVRTGEMEEWLMGASSSVMANDEEAFFTWPAEQPGGELGAKVSTAQRGKRDGDKYTPKRPIIAAGALDFTELQMMLAMHFKPSGVIFS